MAETPPSAHKRSPLKQLLDDLNNPWSGEVEDDKVLADLSAEYVEQNVAVADKNSINSNKADENLPEAPDESSTVEEAVLKEDNLNGAMGVENKSTKKSSQPKKKNNSNVELLSSSSSDGSIDWSDTPREEASSPVVAKKRYTRKTKTTSMPTRKKQPPPTKKKKNKEEERPITDSYCPYADKSQCNGGGYCHCNQQN
jgi:hypothetical protein